MGSSPANSPRSRGFTLAELVIVVAIIGIVAMVAVPSTSGVDAGRVRVAASEVAQALRFARDLSIAERRVYAVSFDSAAERIRVLRYDTSVSPWAEVYDVRHPLSKDLWDIDFDEYGPARNVNLEATRLYFSPCTIPLAPILFLSGEPAHCDFPANARLDTLTYTLTLGDATATVLLDGLTSRVSVP